VSLTSSSIYVIYVFLDARVLNYFIPYYLVLKTVRKASRKQGSFSFVQFNVNF